jgi:hypothetical protein
MNEHNNQGSDKTEEILLNPALRKHSYNVQLSNANPDEYYYDRQEAEAIVYKLLRAYKFLGERCVRLNDEVTKLCADSNKSTQPKQERIRVLRMLEYEGSRSFVETALSKRSIKGEYRLCTDDVIRDTILGEFPTTIIKIR